jgi:hypothetical protein
MVAVAAGSETEEEQGFVDAIVPRVRAMSVDLQSWHQDIRGWRQIAATVVAHLQGDTEVRELFGVDDGAVVVDVVDDDAARVAVGAAVVGAAAPESEVAGRGVVVAAAVESSDTGMVVAVAAVAVAVAVELAVGLRTVPVDSEQS